MEPAAPTTPAAPEGAAALPPLEIVSGPDFSADLPAVNLAAVEAAGGPATPAPSETPATAKENVPLSKSGKAFDPAKHRAHPDGSPVMVNGRFMPKGRPKGAKTRGTVATGDTGSFVPPDILKPELAKVGSSEASPAGSTPAASAPMPGSPAVETISPLPVEELELIADGRLEVAYVLAGQVFDEKEWQPDSTAEHRGMRAAYVAYLRTQKDDPPSPLSALITVCVAFVLKRLRRINTAKTLAGWMPWLAPYLNVETSTPAQNDSEKKPAPAQPVATVQPQNDSEKWAL